MNSLSAQVTFEEVSQNSGVQFEYMESLKMGGGVASFDYDNDGDDDLYIVGGQNPDGLFQNDGYGNFTNVSQETNVSFLTSEVMTTSVVTGDIDNDGYREIFIGTLGELGTSFNALKPNILLKFNPTSSSYENIVENSQIDDVTFCMGGHFFDSNGDGWLDLYLINYISEPKTLTEGSDVIGFDHECFENQLYINNKKGSFTNQTSLYGLDEVGCSLAATSSDLDNDGDPDIIVANDFGKWLEPNQLYKNEGEGNPYLNISSMSNTDAQMYGMGIAVGDYDEDLDLDFYVTNIGENAFFENQNDMIFENRAAELGIENTFTENNLLTTGWGAILEDFDNDSYLDLYVSNGYVYSVVDVDDPLQLDELYLGSSSHDFTNSTFESNLAFEGTSRGAIYGDWNMDGQLDIITITNETYDVVQNSINFYENKNEGTNWIGFNLNGTLSNRDGYGSLVTVHAEGRSFIRELRGGDSHASQSTSRLHFGLGDIETVDSVEIRWPNGLNETYRNLNMNQYQSIIEGSTTSAKNIQNEIDYYLYLNQSTNVLNIHLRNKIVRTTNIRIFSSSGIEIHNSPIENKLLLQVDLSPYPSGIYFISIDASMNKIIIQKP